MFRGLALTAALAAAMTATPVAAQDAARDEGSGPPLSDLTVGPFRITPSLGLSYGHDSNVTLNADDQDRVSSSFVRVSPSVRAAGGSETNRLQLTYDANYARYFDSPRDDYFDHTLELDWFWNPKLRHTFMAGAGVGWGHDQRGTAGREGELADLPLDVDRYRSTDLSGSYRFGAPGARGRAQVDARARRVEYLNNRELTRFRDRDDRLLGGELGVRIGARTSAVGRVEYGTFEYGTATLDGSEFKYFLGVEWDATAKTSGNLMVGRQAKRFEDPTREEFSGSSWRGSVTWRPRSYSRFDLSTNSETDETNGSGDFILRRDLTLGWAYDWNTRIRSTVDVGFARETFGGSPREDESRWWGISGDYVLRRWLRFGASYRSYFRDSSIGEFQYRQNVFLLSLEISP